MQGAVSGIIGGFLLIMWLTIGAATLTKPPVVYLPTSIDQCTNDTFNDVVVQHRIDERDKDFKMPMMEVNRSSVVVPEEPIPADE